LITVRDRREDLGWKQKELAQKSGVGLSTVWRAEHKIPIRSLLAKKISRALGMLITELDILISDAYDCEEL